MKLLTRRLRVQSVTLTLGRDGAGYCIDQWMENRLQRETLLCGVVIWKTVLDTESIPSHAWVGEATIGPVGWVSKFAPFGKDGIKGYI